MNFDRSKTRYDELDGLGSKMILAHSFKAQNGHSPKSLFLGFTSS